MALVVDITLAATQLWWLLSLPLLLLRHPSLLKQRLVPSLFATLRLLLGSQMALVRGFLRRGEVLLLGFDCVRGPHPLELLLLELAVLEGALKLDRWRW